MVELSRARIRLRVLADAAGLAAATFLLAGGLTTVANLSAGVYPSSSGRDLRGTATVLACDRLGPVSVHGFGYWWRCVVEVRLPGDRVVTVFVGRSIVSPDDIGEQVPFLQHCEGEDYEDCTYGRPGRSWSAAGAAIVQIFAVAVAMVGTWLTAVAVYNALRARRHWWHETFDPRQR